MVRIGQNMSRDMIFPTVKLRAEHHLEFLSLKGVAHSRPSLYLSKCHIVGNHMSWFILKEQLKNVDGLVYKQEIPI